MAGGGSAGDRSLQETPTWAVAAVCAVFVIISVLIERGIHSLGNWFKKRQQKAMIEALEKIKSELMILGFISLLLTVGTRFIPEICISEKYLRSMLPCKYSDGSKNKDGNDGKDSGGDRRRLLSISGNGLPHRVLAAASGSGSCGKPGEMSLITQSGVHQLHIFIFVLALLHVLYSVMTMALGKAKMKKWKSWELETGSLEYEYSNDPTRFRFAHQTSFAKRHSGISALPGIKWIVAFFRQFFGSVSKVDYLTIRNGFIKAHFAPNSKFDFHSYIKRCMEDDFKVVVGISIPLWLLAIFFLLMNVYRWHTLSWLVALPLVILLMVGTKLEMVIMEMAKKFQEKSSVVLGAPLVEPNNKYFWFNRPHWILLLIHYTLFLNAFQMSFFMWTLYEFGLKSCFHENLGLILARVLVGLALQFLCSYITFPLYSLVTQMGSHMKQAIFEEQTAKALLKWRKAAKEKKKMIKKSEGGGGGSTHPGLTSGETTPSTGSSPIHLLHNFKTGSSQVEVESVYNTSPPYYTSDNDELSEFGGSSHNRNGSRDRDEEQDHPMQSEDGHGHGDISFGRV
ncbi:hypothetical protein K2173_027792 [Erythroxylum novogranatense]|uniref:MLO-like protein n=1 Tax=Erythroxylum novogranatense TaxID=1862640 RepID=A0AAV8U071_9ROSI|nr:hypothetical protein K2173_027792 [Erythroxylum novogranatense]